ncbi:MAG: IMP dehydrogenase, partial [Cyanobacteria bacterium HKST-UBA05]|nr:IMP dehydrogenase [Cyanobacteria bacterium HKST-UBA05]
ASTSGLPLPGAKRSLPEWTPASTSRAQRYLNENDQPRLVAQGVTGSVVDKGALTNYLPYLYQGICQGFQDIGVRSIPDLHRALYAGQTRFERRTPAAQKEGGVHNLHAYQMEML